MQQRIDTCFLACRRWIQWTIRMVDERNPLSANDDINKDADADVDFVFNELPIKST